VGDISIPANADNRCGAPGCAANKDELADAPLSEIGMTGIIAIIGTVQSAVKAPVRGVPID
jgi:hypothetical protein